MEKVEKFSDFIQDIIYKSYEYDDDSFYNFIYQQLTFFDNNPHSLILGRIITKEREQSIFLSKDETFKESFRKFLTEPKTRYSSTFKKLVFKDCIDNDKDFNPLILNSQQNIFNKTDIPKKFITNNNINSLCFLPLQWEGRIVGLIISHSKAENSYKTENLELFNDLAKILSRVLKTRRDRHRKNILLKLNKQRLIFSKNIQDIKNLDENISDILQISHSHLKEYMSTKNMLIYTFEKGKEKIEKNTRPQFSLINREPISSVEPKYLSVIESANHVLCHPEETINWNTREKIASGFKNIGIKNNIHDLSSLMITPMRITNERAIGIFIMFNEKPFTYDESDCNFVNEISDQTAIIINNLYANYKHEESSKMYEEILKLVNSLSNKVSKPGLNEEEILNKTCECIKASNIISENNFYIAMNNAEKNEISFPIYFEDGVNRQEDDKEKVSDRPFGNGRTEWIISNDKKLIIKTKEESIKWYDEEGVNYLKNPYASWIGVPIHVEEKVIGVIVIFHPDEDNLYEDKHLEVLKTLAQFVGIAIENSRQGHIIAQQQDMMSRNLAARDTAHRFNNLIGTIPMWVEEAREALESENPDLDDVGNCLDHVMNDARVVLNEVKNISRVKEEREFNIVTMIKALLEKIKVQHRNKVREKHLKINFESRFDEIILKTHYSSLEHAIFVVLDNAVDAILEKGEGVLTVNITCSNKNNENWQQISIQDTGCGITKENESNIFKLDFSTKGLGHGYGLWRTKHVIEQEMKGSINFSSEGNKGTTFNIELPVKSYK